MMVFKRRLTFAVFVLSGLLVLTGLLYWRGSGRPVSESPASETGPSRPNDWFYRQRSYPHSEPDFAAMRAAQAQAQHLRAAALAKRTRRIEWEPAGPTNIGGRITALAAHPAEPQRLLLGAADGGIWLSEDAGNTWEAVFDFNSSLSIGALAVDPQNPGVFYAGTGEANGSADSYPGTGLYKSSDGGRSWFFSGLPESYHIGRIVVNPGNSQEVFVAACGKLWGKNTERGIYRSRNGGDSWEQVLFVSDSTAAIDVVIDPVNPDNLYAAMWERIRRPGQRIAGGITSGIYKSEDGGDHWTLLSNGLPPASPTVGRIGLALAPSAPQVLYAIYADHPGFFSGIYKTDDGGASWTRTNDGDLSGIFANFGWYFGNVVVDPKDPDKLFALGVWLYRSSSGGSRWELVGSTMHVDHHALWINAAQPHHLLVGNDGGLYLSLDGGTTYRHISGLPITQFYAATVDFNNPRRLYGGTQDNGTLVTPGGAPDDWKRILGGDGFYVVVDPGNPEVVYAETQWGGLHKSLNGGDSFFDATNGIDINDRTNWMTPVVMDPSNQEVLYYGTQRLYRTRNGALSWEAISGDLSDGPYPGMPSFGTVTTISVAPTNSLLIYAGTDDGNLWVTADGGTSWRQIDENLPRRWITRVTAHPQDDKAALVSYSGYRSDEYRGHLFRTGDRGNTWEDVSGNLPAAPIQAVIIDPDDPERYYAGTDVGVFFTMDAGESWAMLGGNLPASGVMDLVFHHPTRTLVAATHGRGMFKIALNLITALEDGKTPLPEEFSLNRIYPNPFNPATTIDFTLPRPGEVRVEIYDLLGRKVRELFAGRLPAGRHQVKWEGRTSAGERAVSGTYLVRLNAGGQQESRRITLVR